MARAFLFVLDSFGIGGAPDAKQFGDEGSDTYGHIVERCARGEGDRPGLRSGPLQLPHMDSLGLAHAAALATGRPAPAGNPPGGFFGAASEVSSGKDTPSGHWEIAGVPVTFDWGYFPDTVPTFPAELTDAAIRRVRTAGHSGQLPCLGHRNHRTPGRRACRFRQADLLHLGGFRHSDCRPRNRIRPGAALRSLRGGAEACGALQHRPRYRAALCR